MNSTFRILILIISMVCYLPGQIVSTSATIKLILKGSKPVALGDFILINDTYKPWENDLPITVSIPRSLQCIWNEGPLFMKYKDKIMVIKEPSYKGGKCRFLLPEQINPGESCTIMGLSIRNHFSSTKAARIRFLVGEEKCEYFSIYPWKSWGKIKEGIGKYLVADIDIELTNKAKYLLNHNILDLPIIYLKVGKPPSYIPKNSKIRIYFPERLNNVLIYNVDALKCTIGGKSKFSLLNKDISLSIDTNSIILTINENIKSGEIIKIDGIKINTNKYVLDPVPISINICGNEDVRKYSDNKVSIAGPKVTLLENPKIIINQPPVEFPEITINTGKIEKVFTKQDDIFIHLPNESGLYWDRQNSYLKIIDSRKKIVTSHFMFIDNNTIKIDLHEDLGSNGLIHINGLKFGCRNENSRNNYNEKQFVEAFIYGNNNELGQIQLDKEIQIAKLSVQSSEGQIFRKGDISSEVNPFELRISSNYKCFNEGDTIKCRLSSELKGSWSPDFNQIKYSGSISPYIKRIFYNNPQEFCITLISSLPENGYLKLNGLKLIDLKSESEGTLDIYYNSIGFPIAQDSHNWIISDLIFDMANDQMIFKDATKSQENNSVQLLIRTLGLRYYLKGGQEILIELPEEFPVGFDINKQKCFLDVGTRKYLSPNIEYISDKKLTMRIINDVPDNIELKIGGLKYGNPTNISQEPCNLRMSINRGQNHILNKKYISIASIKSECDRSKYYCELTLSNFNQMDTLILALVDTKGFKWDKNKCISDLKVGQTYKYIDQDNLSFNDEDRIIKIPIIREWGINEKITISGLSIKVKNLFNMPDHAYLSIKYCDWYGEKMYLYPYPICFKNSDNVEILDTALLDPYHSYTNPIIKFSNTQNPFKVPLQNTEYTLPAFNIQNGVITKIDYDNYIEYIRTMNNIPIFISNNELQKARGEAEKLRLNCPDLWYGYYRLAQVYKEDETMRAEGRRLYQKAFTLGYKPSEKYPEVFGGPEQEMARYIEEGIELFKKKQYLKAEEKFQYYLEIEDSLKQETIGRALYWNGRVAFALHDWQYALRFFKQARDKGYNGPNGEYDFITTRLIAQSQDSLDYTITEDHLYYPHIVKKDETTDNEGVVFLTFRHPEGKDEKLSLSDIHSKFNGLKFEHPIKLKERQEYVLHYNPIFNQIVKLSIVTITGIILCGILVL